MMYSQSTTNSYWHSFHWMAFTIALIPRQKSSYANLRNSLLPLNKQHVVNRRSQGPNNSFHGVARKTGNTGMAAETMGYVKVPRVASNQWVSKKRVRAKQASLEHDAQKNKDFQLHERGPFVVGKLPFVATSPNAIVPCAFREDSIGSEMSCITEKCLLDQCLQSFYLFQTSSSSTKLLVSKPYLIEPNPTRTVYKIFFFCAGS